MHEKRITNRTNNIITVHFPKEEEFVRIEVPLTETIGGTLMYIPPFPNKYLSRINGQ
jgi:hypothetical protein